MGNGELTKASILATICVENNAVTFFYSEGLLPPRTLLILTSELAPSMTSYTIIGILSCLLCEHRGQPEATFCATNTYQRHFSEKLVFPSKWISWICCEDDRHFFLCGKCKVKESCQRWIEKGSHLHHCSRPGKCTQGGCVVPWSQERTIIFWGASCIKKN